MAPGFVSMLGQRPEEENPINELFESAPVAAQGLSDIVSALKNRRAESDESELLQSLFSKMQSGEMPSEEALQGLLSQGRAGSPRTAAASRYLQDRAEREMQPAEKTDEEKLALAEDLEAAKVRGKSRENHKLVNEKGVPIASEIANIISGDDWVSFLPGAMLSGDQREARGRFNALLGEMVGVLKSIESSTGTLTKARMDDINKRLPSFKDSRATALGKMRGVLEMMGVSPDEAKSIVSGKSGSDSEAGGDEVKVKGPDGSIRLVPRSKAEHFAKMGAQIVD